MLDIETFKKPDAEYCVKPFWFWNSRLQVNELLAQVKDMYEHGIGGFFIHARFGLETGYLSQEWFHMVRCCADAAGKYGMKVWLYDENPFPVG